MITDPGIDSRSTVASGIAQLYADELKLPGWSVIRNAPDAVELAPSPVEGNSIRLIHHGLANWERGLRELIGAIRLLPERFSATFMLIGSESMLAALAAEAADLGERVRIVPPAPMAELSETINRYDLEVMFYAPKTRNLEFALPNKLFEAVQGRLGLVIGESPMMAEIVREFGNGVIVHGWSAEDLAAALEPLSGARVAELKQASHRAADVLNAEHERRAFLAAVGAA
jgi:glycosyltransferase involved in cell wall biosynthesis